MRLINFSQPKGMAPKAVRAGTKTEVIVRLGQRKNGVTLTELAGAMTKIGGQENTVKNVRAWVQPSYLKDKGYGIRSELTANGKDIRLFITCNDLPLDTSRSDVKPNKTTAKSGGKKATKKAAATKSTESTPAPADEEKAA